jgi:hypothetical protein
MKLSICDESTSSSDDDVQPILPSPPSDGRLSTIEESHLENGVDSSSSSRYSSFSSDNLSALSSDWSDEPIDGEVQKPNSVGEKLEEVLRSSTQFSNQRSSSDSAINVVRSLHEVSNRLLLASNDQENGSDSPMISESVVSLEGCVIFMKNN